MNKKVNKFIKELRDALLRVLMGYTADLRFYDVTLQSFDEDKLREELNEVTVELGREQHKDSYKVRGVVIPDKRDMKKVGCLSKRQQELNRSIDRMNEFNALKLQTKEKVDDNLRYLTMIDNPVKEFVKELEDVSKI